LYTYFNPIMPHAFICWSKLRFSSLHDIVKLSKYQSLLFSLSHS
jgi:hypothetical protein